MKKVTKRRWSEAQKREMDYWEKYWKKNIEKHKILVKPFWNYHLNKLEKHMKIKKDTKVLEIGGGPVPFISYIPKSKRYALDSLMDYYVANFKMKKGIKWIKGTAEKLPFKKSYFDVVLTTNVIDHVSNPKKMLNEINRVLRKDGILYITIECHNNIEKTYRVLREKFGVGDKCHPHSFNINDVKKLLNSSGFEIIKFEKATKGLGSYAGNTSQTIYEKKMISKINERITKVLSKLGNKKYIGDIIFVVKAIK